MPRSMPSSAAMNSSMPFRAERRMARARGVTLIELVVVVAIAGVLAAMAMPTLGSLVRDQRIKTAVGDVHASIIYARSEAIKRNQNVAMCSKNADGSGCGNITNWGVGWIVFLDENGDGVPNAATDYLKKQDAFTGVTVSGTINRLTYQRDGRLAAALDADFMVGAAGATARCVAVSVSGRPNIKPTC